MTSHRLDPAPGTTRDVFSREHAPVLAVDPGDTVTVRSLDASGYLARPAFPGEDGPRMISPARGHCLTGPIEVRGAQPGDVLALRLLSLRPGDWGWTVSGGRDTPVTRRLGVAEAPPAWLLWELECPMTTSVIIGLAPDRPLGTIHAEAPGGRVTFGFDADLNVAMGDALDAMVTWLQALSGLGRAAALALASTCVDLRITQVANQTWGVHAVLPAGVMTLPG